MLDLVELSERSSAISLVQMVVAFEAFQLLSAVRVRPMTAISDLDTIHRNVIDSTTDKRAAIVIVPYHKALQHDGAFHSLGSAYREAPCSTAILVDRRLGGHAQVSAKNVAFSVAALFSGGPDYREALAYATRMAEHLGVAYTLARFHPNRPVSDEDRHADKEAVEAFKAKVGSVKDSSVRFEEREGYTKEEELETIVLLSGFNVFVVGRMPPTAPLVEKPDKLGPVGSFLVSPVFRTSASMLVIKRRRPRRVSAESRRRGGEDGVGDEMKTGTSPEIWVY